MVSLTLNRVAENMNAAGVSRAVLAYVVGMKAPTLSAAFQATVSLGAIRESELLTASHKILSISVSLRPFELKDAGTMKLLVDKMTDGVLTED